ncbi:hypothetical protein MXB_3805 [Myxobolus squamalis]|nr:hypothetical protein MXB_3805 [Myxobolus squamalis]
MNYTQIIIGLILFRCAISLKSDASKKAGFQRSDEQSGPTQVQDTGVSHKEPQEPHAQQPIGMAHMYHGASSPVHPQAHLYQGQQQSKGHAKQQNPPIPTQLPYKPAGMVDISHKIKGRGKKTQVKVAQVKIPGKISKVAKVEAAPHIAPPPTPPHGILRKKVHHLVAEVWDLLALTTRL